VCSSDLADHTSTDDNHIMHDIETGKSGS